MPDNADVLYILGTGSRWKDNELRYSLRSVERYMPHKRVVIVGERPGWLRDVTHIPARDPTPGRKQYNSINKLGVALASGELGSGFVLMNDDFFILKPVSHPIPPAHKGPLSISLRDHPSRSGDYFSNLKAMRDHLHKRGIEDAKDYSLHIPFSVETEAAREVMAEMKALEPSGYMWRSAYGNLCQIGGERQLDVKIHRDWKPPQRGWWCMSTDAGVVTQRPCQIWLAKTYPEPSRYESA